MDAHELAEKLLAGPNMTVCIYQYTGGGDEIREIKDVVVSQDPYAAECLILQTYVER